MKLNSSIWKSAVAIALLIVQPVAAKRQRIIVGLGDSTTAGTPHFLSPLEAPPKGQGNPEGSYTYWVQKARPQWKVFNYGVNGERSDEIKNRLPAALALNPDVVILLAGVNDIYQGRALADLEEDIAIMVSQIRSKGTIPILATVLPFNRSSLEHRDGIRTFNVWLKQFAAQKNLSLCDLNEVTRDPNDHNLLKGTTDGLHPDVPTAHLMGDAVVRWVDAVIAK